RSEESATTNRPQRLFVAILAVANRIVHSRIPVRADAKHAMSWSSTPSANAGMNWLGYSSREELEASGILDKWAQKQQQTNLLPPRHSSIQLCSRCQGHRIEKIVYNSMVLEQNCSQCDGEGVIPPQQTSPMRTTSA
ncbi:hypothetical protein L917_00130, partial [Phytophthora nicotianae]